MKVLSKEDIVSINKTLGNTLSDQGVFLQPTMIPITVKGYVVYQRIEIGGSTGGSWTGSKSKQYINDVGDIEFEVLDLVLEKLKPNITHIQYKKVLKLIQTNEDSEKEYYGNSVDYLVKYVVLNDLYKLLDTF